MSAYRDSQWNYDVNSFERWKRMRSILRHAEAKARCTERLAEIQARWPQFISLAELVEEPHQ